MILGKPLLLPIDLRPNPLKFLSAAQSSLRATPDCKTVRAQLTVLLNQSASGPTLNGKRAVDTFSLPLCDRHDHRIGQAVYEGSIPFTRSIVDPKLLANINSGKTGAPHTRLHTNLPVSAMLR